MSSLLSRLADRWRGSGAYSLTTPPMDGALRPNQLIESADLATAAGAPDNLVVQGDRVLFTSGRAILALGDACGSPVPAGEAPAEIACMAAAVDGSLALGLVDGRILLRGGVHDGLELRTCGDRPVLCPTALLFEDTDTLLVCLGSQDNRPDAWKADLMERRATGSIWRVHLGRREASCLADALAFPYGVMRVGNGDLVVSESWRSQLVAIAPNGGSRPALLDLPGYPARIVVRPDGAGAWIAIFAPRSQLIEFVLRERRYCERMMREMPPDLWVAPSLHAPESFLEPLQGGALKQLGILKPWAPTRSYGLVVQLDANLRPVSSFHSRADGRRHGVTSCVEVGGRLIATSKGGDAIVAIALPPSGAQT
ncbi:strictosidine synthase [Methylocapsa sp. S129]|uniref:strictosidine synthase n=1 Tax=Methylocapsa sp. S129 TaxID=1641869 RepID=UPI00131E08DF|nr:strictosidine synthase [Methylocapsa sp. S129]